MQVYAILFLGFRVNSPRTIRRASIRRGVNSPQRQFAARQFAVRQFAAVTIRRRQFAAPSIRRGREIERNNCLDEQKTVLDEQPVILFMLICRLLLLS